MSEQPNFIGRVVRVSGWSPSLHCEIIDQQFDPNDGWFCQIHGRHPSDVNGFKRWLPLFLLTEVSPDEAKKSQQPTYSHSSNRSRSTSINISSGGYVAYNIPESHGGGVARPSNPALEFWSLPKDVETISSTKVHSKPDLGLAFSRKKR